MYPFHIAGRSLSPSTLFPTFSLINNTFSLHITLPHSTMLSFTYSTLFFAIVSSCHGQRGPPRAFILMAKPNGPEIQDSCTSQQYQQISLALTDAALLSHKAATEIQMAVQEDLLRGAQNPSQHGKAVRESYVRFFGGSESLLLFLAQHENNALVFCRPPAACGYPL